MVKPADDPEFFRKPPPPGRSRESAIRLDAEGKFWSGDEPFEHAGLEKGFRSWIARHPDDGRYVLSNGYDWSYVTVEDTPFFVEGVFARGGTLWLRFAGGAEQPWNIASTIVRTDGRLVTEVEPPGGNEATAEGSASEPFFAKFTPLAQSQLEPWLAEDPDASAPQREARVPAKSRLGIRLPRAADEGHTARPARATPASDDGRIVPDFVAFREDLNQKNG